jgi:hypothetical protein
MVTSWAKDFRGMSNAQTANANIEFAFILYAFSIILFQFAKLRIKFDNTK